MLFRSTQYIEGLVDIIEILRFQGFETENKEELILDFNIEGYQSRSEVHMALSRYQHYYNKMRPCFALDYDTPHNFYERFKNGKIERRNTFKDRQLSDKPKLSRQKK